MLEWINKILDIKQNKVNIYFNPHGEPLLYSDIEKIIKKLRSNSKIDTISVITNGVLLNNEKVERLKNSGLSQINISLNGFSEETSSLISGSRYPIERVKRNIENIEDLKVIISPVLLYGYNEKDIEKIVEWISRLKKKNIKLGIQNFLPYKRGRNPGKGISFDKFNKLLSKWENKYNIKLIDPEVWIKIKKDNSLMKEYSINDKVNVKIVSHGRYDNEFLGITDRFSIIIRNSKLRIGQNYNTRIVKNKDNIYYGV
jgi:uncharacterized Fe-S cluster-containing radical SAM superfamily enzyme